ncbi:MAG: SAVED domain-containing protein [Alphaproteobacteria bacterium]|nr:SAVED domain-containing protein [Alphaproteobacteria bacterium]
MSAPRTLVLLHPLKWGITREEALEALGDRPIAGIVFIDPAWDDANPTWETTRQAQERLFEQRVRSHLEANPNDVVAYFGAAPIPLAVHLGFLLSTWSVVECYNQDQDTKKWAFPTAERTAVEVTPSNLPTDEIETPGEVVLRVSASYPVHAVQVRPAVDSPFAHVAVDVKPLQKGQFQSLADQDAAVSTVINAVEGVLGVRPQANRLHLFMAGPVGFCASVGTRLKATIVPPVALYQYNAAGDPKYQHVLDLQGTAPETPLTAEDRDFADGVRAAWNEEFQRLVAWVRTLARVGNGAGSWVDRLGIPRVTSDVLPDDLRALPALGVGPFKDSSLTTERDVDGGFIFDPDDRAWSVSDRLLCQIGRRVDKTMWGRAARLFFLHEGLHVDQQGVTTETALSIGVRHPMIAEEFDFHADAWAAINELAYSWELGAQDDPKRWLRDSIAVNTEVIWAFVSPAQASRRLELRRLRRLLIWYWQDLRVREAADLAAAAKDVLSKPVVSLSGPPLRSEGGRTFLELACVSEVGPEIALLKGVRLVRYGSTDAVDLGAALAGLRALDPGPLKRALAGLFETIRG